MTARCWIIGGGRFGWRAAAILSRIHVPGAVTVVDQSREALAEVEAFGVDTVQADGVDYLLQHLSETHGPKWVVPCVPYHLYYRWLQGRLGNKAVSMPVPADWALNLPHPIPADQGGYYLSQADFICPPDCPEPAGICTHTGMPRPGILFRDLGARPCPGFQVLVQKSRQLAPGLGGLKRKDMFQGLKRITRAPRSMAGRHGLQVPRGCPWTEI